MRFTGFIIIFLFEIVCMPRAAVAQQNFIEEQQRRNEALETLPSDAVQRLFSKPQTPSTGPSRPLGKYSKGCLAGAVALALDGPHWQVMRSSRSRFWGHSELVEWLKQFSEEAYTQIGWPGLLIGDMSQPRGGPMLTGHMSHQIGLEADLWLMPASSERRFTPDERENMPAMEMVKSDLLSVDAQKFSDAQYKLIRLAALSPQIDLIIVNAAIKKAMCERNKDHPAWLKKVQPYAGHTFHMHVALACPYEEKSLCINRSHEESIGCGKELDEWFTKEARFPKPEKNRSLLKAHKLKDLPQECETVLSTP